MTFRDARRYPEHVYMRVVVLGPFLNERNVDMREMGLGGAVK